MTDRMHILGDWYFLDQEFQSDRISLLKDEDSDVLHEKDLPAGMTGEEAIATLYLDYHNTLQYKPESLTAVQFIKMFESSYDAGRMAGRQEKLKLIIEELENQLED
jgi:hypothetical protein